MLKVVLVEDEPLVRQGLALAVDWAAMGCVAAGKKAAGSFGRPAQVLFTDVRMPKLDGIAMIARLRQEGCAADDPGLFRLDLEKGAKSKYVEDAVGYSDTAYFSAQFKKAVGISPSEYQDRCE